MARNLSPRDTLNPHLPRPDIIPVSQSRSLVDQATEIWHCSTNAETILLSVGAAAYVLAAFRTTR